MAALPEFLDAPQQIVMVENHATSLGQDITAYRKISKISSDMNRHRPIYGKINMVSTQLVKILDVPCIIHTKMQL